MKSTRKRVFVYILGFVVILLVASPRLVAQQDSPPITGDADDNFNSPPCDFTNAFYTANGIDVTQLDTPGAARFGLFRRTGPPAPSGFVNWLVDNTGTDPDRNNVRILATTAGFIYRATADKLWKMFDSQNPQ